MSSRTAALFLDAHPPRMHRMGMRLMSCTNRSDPSPNIGWRAVDILVGQFGRMPDKEAAGIIGVSVDTWKTWKGRRAKPGTDHLSQLFRRFGRGFVAHVMAPFEESHLDAKQARIKAEIRELEAKFASLETHRARFRTPPGGPAHEPGQVVGGARRKTDEAV